MEAEWRREKRGEREVAQTAEVDERAVCSNCRRTEEGAAAGGEEEEEEREAAAAGVAGGLTTDSETDADCSFCFVQGTRKVPPPFSEWEVTAVTAVAPLPPVTSVHLL